MNKTEARLHSSFKYVVLCVVHGPVAEGVGWFGGGWKESGEGQAELIFAITNDGSVVEFVYGDAFFA